MIGPPICNATHATVKVPGAPDREYTRNPQETLAAFKARMVRELPVRYEGRELWADRGGPGLGCMTIILNASKDEASSEPRLPIDGARLAIMPSL